MSQKFSNGNVLRLALLAADNEEDELIPTALETACQQIHRNIDIYCVVGK